MNIQSDMSEWEQIPPIRLDVNGDLLVEGWEQRALDAQTDDDDPELSLDHEDIFISSNSDLRIRLPVGSRLVIDCNSDVSVQRVRGDVQIKHVGGDLHVVESTAVDIKEINGDLHLQQATNLSCRTVGGDAVIEAVAGAVAINTNGDLHIRHCHGAIVGNARGDAHLHVTATAPEVKLNAQGDIHCELGETVEARVKVVCGGELSIQSRKGQHRAGGRGVHSLNVGAGDGSLALIAKGDVVITGAEAVGAIHSVSGDAAADAGTAEDAFGRLGEELGRVGEEMGRLGEELGREFGSMGVRIAEKINSKLRRNLEREQRKAARAAAKAAASNWAFGFNIPEPPRPPQPPSAGEQSEPVTEEERLMVLRMVEEGKITASEAETLLAALEGDSPS